MYLTASERSIAIRIGWLRRRLVFKVSWIIKLVLHKMQRIHSSRDRHFLISKENSVVGISQNRTGLLYKPPSTKRLRRGI